MPCSEKRARRMMEKGEAKPLWKNQIFCIQLLKDVVKPKYQDVIVGIDPGSRKEGITVATKTNVVLNILAEAKSTVKEAVAMRAATRRARRNRKTPYRACRWNRSVKDSGWIAPSTKARWDQKVRILAFLKKIIPVTVVAFEDIVVSTKKGNKNWNTNFSPLEVGKAYFAAAIKGMGMVLRVFQGFNTCAHRAARGFEKIKEKAKNVWTAHCVDSHSLIELLTGSEIRPFSGMYLFENFNFYRRQLHVQNFTKGGKRRIYGGTVSLGIPRGTLVRHPKFGLTHVGGSSNGRISLHSLTGKRLTRNAKKDDLITLSINKWRTQFLP